MPTCDSGAFRNGAPAPARPRSIRGAARIRYSASLAAADPPSFGCAGNIYEGFLPWATLGVQQTDYWGTRLRYRVSAEFTRRGNDPAWTCGSVRPRCPDAIAWWRGKVEMQTGTQIACRHRLPCLTCAMAAPNGAASESQ